MFKNSNLKRILVFSIPILILIAMTISPLLTTFYGIDIKLKTQPVDPRDLFRGDYIVLSYEIEEINFKNIDNDVKDYFKSNNHEYSIRAYASLEKDKSGFYNVKNVSLEKPNQGIYLKGLLRKHTTFEPIDKDNVDFKNSDGEYVEPEGKYVDVYNMDYNIDKYFVPENTGKKLENASLKGDITAVVRVRKGNSLLKDVYIK